MADHVAGAAFHRLVAVFVGPPQAKPGVIDIEAAVETGGQSIQRVKD